MCLRSKLKERAIYDWKLDFGPFIFIMRKGGKSYLQISQFYHVFYKV